MKPRYRLLACVFGLCTALPLHAADAQPTFSFGVVSQRSAVLTAEYWNPILNYASRRARVALLLKVARTSDESSKAAANGEYDFIYSNHIFKPRVAASGYRVILSPRDEGITAQIVTLPASSLRSVADLTGKEVGFPSPAALVAYVVPMDHLTRRGISVTPVFGGNQEGIIAQLQAGTVPAAAVNSQVLREYANRWDFRYRVIWESNRFQNTPIAAHPRVPKAAAAAVQKALADMATDPEGFRILEASARLVGQKPPYGFRPASPADFRSYVEFYRSTVLKEIH